MVIDKMVDIGSGAPDKENGHFAELGWAKPFLISGTATRDVSWNRGNILGANVSGG
ncbi:hypothetical protein [Streptomyces sp. NBC_01367]|uniref:hypothetical protein n=1 Tax=Streptomyces sp. NBC_01367 TaxID=2903841 RepID=UPI003253E1E3